MSHRIPATAARKKFAEVVQRSARGERIKLTRYGNTLAVLIPKRDLTALEECEGTRIERGGRRRGRAG